MTRFQRMIVIPQEEYLQLSSVQQAKQPLTQQFYTLENQYQEEGKVRDPYQRLMLQSSTLENMKELKEKMRNDIAVNTPKPYQSRAKSLFNSLESFLKFNERGEIYDKDDVIIPNSHVEDLIQHAVRDRRRNMIPLGWSQFVDILRERNVPRSVLNRNTLDEIEYKPIIVKEEPMDMKPKLRGKRRSNELTTNVKRMKRDVKAPTRYIDFLSKY